MKYLCMKVNRTGSKSVKLLAPELVAMIEARWREIAVKEGGTIETKHYPELNGYRLAAMEPVTNEEISFLVIIDP